MADTPPLTGPVGRAVLVYALDAVLALLATAVVFVFALKTHVMALLIAAIPALLTLAASTAVVGLLTANQTRVERGARVAEQVHKAMLGGIAFLALAVVAAPFTGGIERNELLGVLMIIGFMAIVAGLTWYSDVVLRHPAIADHLRRRG